MAGLLAAWLVGCAPGISVVSSVTPAPASAPATVIEARTAPWTIRVREHLDLWLHGFAMLQTDSSRIPYFRRDYRSALADERSRLQATTLLDGNATTLRARMAANPGLTAAQFIPLYFTSWEDLQQAAETFLQLNGDPRAAGDQRSAENVATFAAYFPSSADRDWLRLFLESLNDERAKFYDAYWRERQRELGPVFTTVDSLWQSTYAARFEAFLRNSQQRDGEVLLSLPLAGEGRTLTDAVHHTTTAVGFPLATASADAMVFVFAHEIVGKVANAVVADHTSPAERRGGASDRYSSLAAVRGGAMLLARIAPELVAGYMRYYLGLAVVTDGDRDREQVFAATFPLPDELRDALHQQVDIILSGI